LLRARASGGKTRAPINGGRVAIAAHATCVWFSISGISGTAPASDDDQEERSGDVKQSRLSTYPQSHR
jgi:hypothetical protein